MTCVSLSVCCDEDSHLLMPRMSASGESVNIDVCRAFPDRHRLDSLWIQPEPIRRPSVRRKTISNALSKIIGPHRRSSISMSTQTDKKPILYNMELPSTIEDVEEEDKNEDKKEDA